jgi:alpha-tubulin suppressor-like RCC1 family protein
MMPKTLLSWGSRWHGHGHEADVELPRVVASPTPIKQVACGELHTLVLSIDGRVLSWGSGLMGVLGTGELSARSRPAEVTALRTVAPIVAIAAGRHRTPSTAKPRGSRAH